MGVRTPWVEGVWHDLRHGLRAMRTRPGFTALALVTLAFGIGVNAATIALAYGLLLRPLPYRDPSSIAILNLLFADGGDLGFSPGVVEEWLPRLRTVDAAAAYHTREVTVRSGDRSTVIPAAFVTDRFFDVLGVPAERGHAPRDPSGLVVGRRAAGGPLRWNAEESIGTLVSIGDQGRTISGTTPSDFAFPNDEIAVWLPATRLPGYSRIVVRLKPGTTLDQLREDANRVRLELDPTSTARVSVARLGESVVGGMRNVLTAALAGSLLVLLVACANVATLFIGRDIGRQRELAARMALGATASRLVRSVFLEALLIAGIASLLGVGLGAAMLRLFTSQASGTISGLHQVAMDGPIAMATAAVTVAVTLLCGAFPAWHAGRLQAAPFLRAAAGSHPRAWRLRGTLVVVQIAACCVLLIGAGLLGRTVSALMQADHGFQPDGALEARVVLSDTVLFDEGRADTVVRALIERVRAMPGVRHAGFGTTLPPRTPPILISVRLVTDDRDESRFMHLGSVTPGYLQALGARFLAGRDFDEADDRADAAIVAILSASAARFYFGDEDPVGRTIARFPSMLGVAGQARVIGVVDDIKYEGLDSPAGSTVYIPWATRPLGSGYLVVRSSGDPMRYASGIRSAADALNPTVPVPELQSLEDALVHSIANRRVRAVPAIGFGVLSLCLACIGVLATLSTFVAERRRDLAIRAALGASPAALTWSVVGRGLVLTGLGLLVGLGLGAAAARGLSSVVYGVGPHDPMTFIGTTLAIGGGTVLMTYAAARRAGSANPLLVLKDD